MTKQKLPEELKTKVKPGIKPSHLKRSKSLGDIPSAPPLPANQPNIQQLETEKNLLEAQNKELRKQLEKTNQDWANLAQKRVDNLKKEPNPRITELEKELEQTVKDATDEIEKQEKEIKQLKTKLTQSQNRITDLTSQVNIYQRAAELRINVPEKSPNSDWWSDYGPVILLLSLYALSTWLLNHNKPQRNYE